VPGGAVGARDGAPVCARHADNAAESLSLLALTFNGAAFQRTLFSRSGVGFYLSVVCIVAPAIVIGGSIAVCQAARRGAIRSCGVRPSARARAHSSECSARASRRAARRSAGRAQRLRRSAACSTCSSAPNGALSSQRALSPRKKRSAPSAVGDTSRATGNAVPLGVTSVDPAAANRHADRQLRHVCREPMRAGVGAAQREAAHDTLVGMQQLTNAIR
jgi:hypothetical protein